ncbi:MAG: sugar transferase [Clostridia bacterium]|nr:sugar transferase [Clostridia bacterium]
MYAKYFKRIFDFSLSLIALIILSPVFLILTIIGTVAVKGNPFFTQLRPGKIDKKSGKEKIFKLVKFRTMSNEKDKDGNLLPDELRLNKYGKILRSTSLDELPELWNILKGDMSIVGPRPLLVEYLPYYTEKERHRHDVRPGLTGLAQINGRNFVAWDPRLAFDVQYINNITFKNDITIILKTALKFIKKEDIAVNTNAVETNFAVERRLKMKEKQESEVL